MINFIDYTSSATGTTTISTGFKGIIKKIECSGSATVYLFNDGVVDENILGTNASKLTIRPSYIFYPADSISSGTANPSNNSLTPHIYSGNITVNCSAGAADSMRILIYYEPFFS